MSGIENINKVLSLLGPDDRNPTEDEITLEIPQVGLTIKNWISYDFHNDWTHANSSWNVSIADGNYQTLQRFVQNKNQVVLKINGAVQATGYVDKMDISSSAKGGTIYTLSGRDALSRACDSCISPKFNFGNDGTLTVKDLMTKLFSKYGFEKILVDDTVNRNRLAGVEQVPTFSPNSDPDQPDDQTFKEITVALNKKYRPHWSEGVYSFAERLGKRFGFHIWCSADGKNIYCGQPTFNSPPIGNLIHRTNISVPGEANPTNVISSRLAIRTERQPAIIVGFAGGGGGPSKYQPLKTIMVNELLHDKDTPFITSIKNEYKEAKIIDRRPASQLKRPKQIQDTADTYDVAYYVHDDESKTLEQLQNFVRNNMAHFQSELFEYRVTVRGHTQRFGDFAPAAIWSPNQIVVVDDDVCDIHQNLWIKSRRFVKDLSGTRTEMVCIIPYTLQLFPTGD